MHGYNFTERVRKVLAMAREEAVKLHHEYVGTEHILLGLVREGEGVAATVLQNLGLELDEIRDRVLEIVKKGRAQFTRDLPDLPYTSRAKKVLELAMAEMRQLHHSYVGTEHLLLGMLAEEKGIAAQVLVDFGCTLEAARKETQRILGTELHNAPPAEDPSDDPPRAPSARLVRGRSVKTEFAGVDGGPQIPSRFLEVIAATYSVATRLRHLKASADDLLIALLEHGEGSAIAVLERLGVSIPDLHRALEARTSSGEHEIGPETMIDSGAIGELLTASMREQHQGSWPILYTWHLLLAILGAQSVAADVLTEAGVTRQRVIAEATRMSG